MSEKVNRYHLTIFLIVFQIITKTFAFDAHNYDEYGYKITSNNYFAALAQNEANRFVVSMVPFGVGHFCIYNYQSSSDYVVSIATGRRQNSSQLFFVYLMTNTSDVIYQTLGLVRFSIPNLNSTDSLPLIHSCDQNPTDRNRIRPVKVWNAERSTTGTLEVEPQGKYAYGFLSKTIFIYDIENGSVYDFPSTRLFSSTAFEPNAMAITTVNDQQSLAILVGFRQVDIERMLPVAYLVRLNPPYEIILVDNYTLNTGETKYVRRRDASVYKYDYVLSVSIHDRSNQVLIGMPYINETYVFSFNQTTLTFNKLIRRPARSISWLDDAGQRAALLLSDFPTLPWSQSRIEVLNISSAEIIYTLPNNQQTLEKWSSQPAKLIRLSRTNYDELVVLSEDGTIILVSSTEPGFYSQLNLILNPRKENRPCPSGTYKSFPGIGPCTICPTRTRSSQPLQQTNFNETFRVNMSSNMTTCQSCFNNSFCPLGSIKDVNKTQLESISQAYSYPSSEGSASFDDILMENAFSLQSDPIRCLLISPFFWSLIVLAFVGFILIVMAFLYYSNEQKKYFHRLQCVFRHSDLIGNGELWFGGLVSLAMIVLIIYTFVFGSMFLRKYPIETSTDADFACDPSLRNSQFSSSMHLLSIIKTDDEKFIFEMLDQQIFTLIVEFIQTGYQCRDIVVQEMFDAYSIDLPLKNCTMNSETATTTLSQTFSNHRVTIQISLSGLNFIGALRICLKGPELTDETSHLKVNQLNYCQSFYSLDQTISQTFDVQLALTRVINRTEYLDYSSTNNFSGIWIPTSSHGSLNDRLAYEQHGSYLRYLSTRNLLTIKLIETDFYILNQQKPIARYGEIIFHNILFTTTIIGIFALAFVLFKLTLMPLVQWSINRELLCLKIFKRGNKTSDNKQSDLVLRRF